MQIREIMTRGVEVIPPDASVRDAAAKMKELDVGALPVCDGQKLSGMVTDRDITVRAVAEGRDPSATKVSDVMSGDLAYCFEDDEVEDAAQVMEVKQIRRLPILNRDKQLVGIVSLGDISVRTVGAEEQDLAGEALEEISEPSEPKR
ncbi:MAG TPA: CBS domain-containing protein [Candidatus Eisenbacteria bacterium]|nr:CBS domain-containing protein [Candidatus Eisenbacteria bacterium]